MTVLVRDRARLPALSPPPARVLVGDVRDPEVVAEAVRGQDAVIIVLGTRDDLGTGSQPDPPGPPSRDPISLGPP